MSKSKNLFTIEEFNQLHHDEKLSIIQIAELYKTYPNKVSRLAKKLGANLRSKKEAQKIALATGRQTHPTKGKKRKEEVKVKISESAAKYWDDMDSKERNRRSELAKKQWKNMTEDQKAELRQKAHQGIKKASKDGSKLELAILENLIAMGYTVRYHKQHLIANEKMHLDMVLPEHNVIIEVDGPSHFEPIWGADTLVKSKDADQRKNGLLLNAGFCVIRVLQKKDLSKKLVRDILYGLEKELDKICEEFPSQGNRLITVGD